MKQPDLFTGEPEDPGLSLPLLVSGLEPATLQTSTAAAISATSKDTQRAYVLDAIARSGFYGCTDTELQDQLGLDGSSERPRRWELWKLDQIQIRRDAAGEPVKRQTRTGRNAVVWVAK